MGLPSAKEDPDGDAVGGNALGGAIGSAVGVSIGTGFDIGDGASVGVSDEATSESTGTVLGGAFAPRARPSKSDVLALEKIYTARTPRLCAKGLVRTAPSEPCAEGGCACT